MSDMSYEDIEEFVGSNSAEVVKERYHLATGQAWENAIPELAGANPNNHDWP